jgi:hypothetical protein
MTLISALGQATIRSGSYARPVHHVVAGAVGLAQHDGDLRHGRVGDRVEHLRAVADDAAGLDLRADHEAGHVHEEDERDAERVAQVDEPRDLVGRVVVEDAAELLGLRGDDARRAPAEAAEPVSTGARPLGLSSKNSPSSTMREMTSCMS